MRLLLLLTTILFFSSCAPKTGVDPLRNSKKLIVKGHSSLYNNGSLKIPFTKIHFVPSISGSMDLSGELFFEDAKMALHNGLKEALASVYIIPNGSRKAYEVSKDVYRVSHDISNDLRQYIRGGGVYLIDKSSLIAKKYLQGAFSSSKKFALDLYNKADKFENRLDDLSKDILASQYKRSKKIYKNALKTAKRFSRKSARKALKHFSQGKNAFVQGYMHFPEKFTKTVTKISESFSGEKFSKAAKNANKFRAKETGFFMDIISDTVSHYGEDISESFAKAGDGFGKRVEEEGVILSSLKSVGWLLKGIVYDGFVKPVAKLAGSTVGLITVNGAIYPVHLIAGEAKETATVMVEVSAQVAKSVYDIVAPSVEFALASILGSGEYLGGKIVSGATLTGGVVASGVSVGSGAVLSGLTKASGFIAGKGSKYIAVPLAVSAEFAGKISYGVLGSTTTAVVGAGTLASAEVVSLSGKTTGALGFATTLAGGTVYSVAKSGVSGIYHLAKAVVLPIGYSFSSGTVLGYSSLTQLQAHTLLAASDALYVVLSLEGPKWVLYTISGKNIESEKSLPAGSIVNLKKMQANDINIKKIELSDDEVQKVLQSLDTDPK